MLVRTVHGQFEIQLNRFKPEENGRVCMIGKLTGSKHSRISNLKDVNRTLLLVLVAFCVWLGFLVHVFYLISSSGGSSALPRQQKKKSLISDSTSKNQSTGGYGVLMGQVWGPGATQAKWLANGKGGSSWKISQSCVLRRECGYYLSAK